MSAQSIINKSFFEHLINRGIHLVHEGCAIEHRMGWLEALSWFSDQVQSYEQPVRRDEIKAYIAQLNAHTSQGKAYALLSREEVEVLYNKTFASQRKLAIEWYAAQRTLALLIVAPPHELQLEEGISLEKLREIRLTQLQFKKNSEFRDVEVTRLIKEITQVENKDELLRRKFLRNKKWYL